MRLVFSKCKQIGMEAGCIKTKANEFAQQDIDPWLKMHKKFLCLYVYCSVVDVTLPNEDLITKRACGHNNYGSLGQIISYFDASLQIPRKVRACCLFFNVCPFLSNQPFFMFGSCQAQKSKVFTTFLVLGPPRIYPGAGYFLNMSVF